MEEISVIMTIMDGARTVERLSDGAERVTWEPPPLEPPEPMPGDPE